ncbi:hypothetical protein GV829_12755 [Sphingomonas lacunae]|uniref:DUF4261 domain-containing protein n=1 Tax=Sphingomonas lacunae TaxID=2698828 RepID=A0A6M4AXW4_9SPHN|nr:hypothetical protein [Sphingomonas lacunae]QJQ33200.1 hypothetical protein GV829_12755 [Sphingomonas lacunae]
MTLPDDLPGQLPPLIPANGPGRLFMLCDPERAEAAISQPAQWSDLLLRLGLLSLPLPEMGGEPVRLLFGDARIDMVQGGAARAMLDDSLSRDATRTTKSVAELPPHMAAVGSAVIALEHGQPSLDRAMETQRLCALAALLAPFVGARHLYWQPARLWSAVDALAQAVTAMEATGLPPVLHLIAFVASVASSGRRLDVSTRGLDWFSGFEMMVDAPADMPEQEVVRRAARLAIDSLLNGDPSGPVDLPGLIAGETVSIAPLAWQDGHWWLPVTISGWQNR